MDKIGEVKRKNIPFYLDEKAFKGFVDRVTNGKYGDRVRVFQTESKNGYDEYRLTAKDGWIEIHATSGVCAGVAFNAYLKKYCRYYYGILTKSGNLPDVPPDTEEPLTDTSVFHYRYAFNYCTFGYSYAFNTWKDWERILDYLILSGYNLVLNPIGNECVWVKLLQKFGYSEQEAKNYISAPNYLPWQWMMNLSAFQSEYSDHWFEEQQEISRKFNARLKEFGMSALMPGYCGAVPDDFGARHKGLTIIDQGFWSGGFVRPAILLPENPIFSEFAKTYYSLQKELLGAEDMHYYSTDPFHEGGRKNSVDLKEYAKAVLNEMRNHDGQAVWALQGWNGNPDREMLSALNKEDVIIMNLHADLEPDGGDDFLGYPHIYSVVNNFGGEHAMRGSADNTYNRPHAMAVSDDSACVGIGVIPEGVECDEILFDIISEVSVRKTLRDRREFLKEYIGARYGFTCEELVDTYVDLFEKVYTADLVLYQHESGLMSCPSPTCDRVCYWAGHSVVEDNSHLIKAAKTLLAQADKIQNKVSYHKDIVAILRQYIGNEAWRYIYPLNQAIADKDISVLEENARQLFRLFDLQEKVVDCDPDFNLQKFLDKAAVRGETEQEKRWLVRVSKLLITFWGEHPDCYSLYDYSPREFGDMLRYFYRPRWEKYVHDAKAAIEKGEEVLPYDRHTYDTPFVYDEKEYPRETSGNIIEVAKDVFKSLNV